MIQRNASPTRAQIAVFAAAAGILVSTVSATASAQMVHVPQSDWRQTDRTEATAKLYRTKNFYFEIRFGPYSPNIDAEFGGTRTPFADTFGSGCGTNNTSTHHSVGPAVYFGLELDYVPLRIPYVGGLGIGLGWGYTNFSASAAYANAAAGSACSPDTTSLMIMPTYGVIAFRGDGLMRETRIPIVPYAKLGAGLAFWKASTEAGAETYQPNHGQPPTYAGNGMTPSLHWALGAMLSLNFLDPHAGARLETAAGMGHAFLFGEYMNEQQEFGKNVMWVGTSTWVLGLAADF